jgi:hypothetical protein
VGAKVGGDRRRKNTLFAMPGSVFDLCLRLMDPVLFYIKTPIHGQQDDVRVFDTWHMLVPANPRTVNLLALFPGAIVPVGLGNIIQVVPMLFYIMRWIGIYFHSYPDHPNIN